MGIGERKRVKKGNIAKVFLKLWQCYFLLLTFSFFEEKEFYKPLNFFSN